MIYKCLVFNNKVIMKINYNKNLFNKFYHDDFTR